MQYRVFDDMTRCTAADVERMLPLVGEKRQAQALRFRFLFGQWACLKVCELLMQHWHLPAPLPDFSYTPLGKPFLAGLPDFSFSHCRRAIAVAFADTPNETVGIDVETVRDVKESLVRYVMNEKEQNQVYTATSRAEEFTRLWTQKEAILKCKGTGIRSDLKLVMDDSTVCSAYRITSVFAPDRSYVISTAVCASDREE